MSLIDRYVTEVGQNLPRKDRADLEAEIRSLIEDTLEARSQAEGRAADETLMVDVLKEFGPPEKMAASYLPPRYLIGPRLFPTFMLVIRIVLVVLGVLALIGLGVDLGQAGQSVEAWLRVLGENLTSFLIGAISALGNVVFIFAILEWALPKTEEKPEDWDPRKLKAQPDTETVNPLSQLVSIAFTIAAFLIFNFYPQFLVTAYMKDGQWVFTPFLTPEFFSYVPWFNILWLLEIVLCILLVRKGHWQPGTHLFQAGIKVFNVIILIMMISGGPIVNLSYPQLGEAGQILETYAPQLNSLVRGLLWLLVIPTGVDFAKIILRLMGRRRPTFVAG